MREVIIYPGEGGYWVAECPSLPGYISQGKTREKAVKNIREAIQGYIAALEEDGRTVPEEPFEAILIAASSLPQISGRDCVKALTKVGFYLKRRQIFRFGTTRIAYFRYYFEFDSLRNSGFSPAAPGAGDQKARPSLEAWS